MGSKDPFNFDDIYKEAGVDNLFVKKSMAEQKAMAKPAPATPPRPQPQHNSPGLATSPGAGLGQLQQRPAVTTPVRPGAGSKPSSSSNLAGLDDPFAELGGISKPPPMAAQRTPVRSPTPPRAPVQQQQQAPQQFAQPAAAPAAPPASAPAAAAPAAHFDLEDMFGTTSSSTTSSSTQQQQKQAAPVAADHHDDPFAAFGAVEGASAAIPAAQPAPAAPAAATAAAASQGSSPHAPRTSSPSRQEAAAKAKAAAAAAAAAAEAATSPRERSQGYAAAGGAYDRPQQQSEQPYQQQPQQPARVSDPARQADPYSSSASGRPRPEVGSFSSLAAERAYGVESVDGGYDRGQMYGGPDGSFSGGSFGGSATGGKGWGGLLKSVTKQAAVLGKKGLKAAQAGLAQLETAIENMDKQGSGRLPEGAGPHPAASANGSGSRHSHHHHQHHQQEAQQQQQQQYDDVPAERVLTMAIHISELPSARQEDALARLPRPVRQKVLALLREQAVIEGEEQLSGSGSGPAGPAAAGFGAGLAAAAAGGGGDGGFIPTHEYQLEEGSVGGSPQRPRSAPHQRAPAAAAAPAAPAAKAAAAAVPAAPPVEEEDLLGLHGSPAPAAAAAAAAVPSKPVDRLASVDKIDDFFSGGAAPAAASSSSAAAAAAGSSSSRSSSAPRPHTAGAASGAAGGISSSRMAGSEGHLADLLGGGGASAAAAVPRRAPGVGDLMGGLEVLHVDVDVTGHGELYAEDDDGLDDSGQEPAIRRQLRAARAAEKHAKMKAALAEKQAKEAAEAERREQQQQHKTAHRERIEAWKNKNKGNVRGLLGSLQTVLWEDSGWQPINMGDLLDPKQVRKAWMKANLLVHPDKVRQRNGSDEQVAIADMIFDALKEAWGQFRG